MLEPQLLLAAYCNGMFPMAVDRRGTIGWFSPDPRAVIPLDDRFHVPHGLRRVWKRCVVVEASVPGRVLKPAAETAAATPKFTVTFDTDFESVIRECAKRKEGTWISKEIVESYCNLHRLGHAHSVEVWQRCHPERSEGSPPKTTEILRSAQNDKQRKLVGGLYGVHIGGTFFGESMFHRVSDASKVALVALVERLRTRGFVLLDTQWRTPHLAQFGAYEIPKLEYLRQLKRAVVLDCSF